MTYFSIFDLKDLFCLFPTYFCTFSTKKCIFCSFPLIFSPPCLFFQRQQKIFPDKMTQCQKWQNVILQNAIFQKSRPKFDKMPSGQNVTRQNGFLKKCLHYWKQSNHSWKPLKGKFLASNYQIPRKHWKLRYLKPEY